MNAYITRLCKSVIHLLELGAHMVRDRTTLVEKCLTFYNILLNIKFAGNCMVTHLAMHKVSPLNPKLFSLETTFSKSMIVFLAHHIFISV